MISDVVGALIFVNLAFVFMILSLQRRKKKVTDKSQSDVLQWVMDAMWIGFGFTTFGALASVIVGAF